MLTNKLMGGGAALAVGQVVITSYGIWTCPAGVYSVSVVCVGGIAAGATGGAGLGYKNNIAVIPGTTYMVGAGGTDAWFINSSIVCGIMSVSQYGAGFTGDGGGNGGNAGNYTAGYGGGGAGGYSGNGGNGGSNTGYAATAGSGGGGGGGGGRYGTAAGGAGGGVGLLGQGSNGTTGAAGGGGGGGGSGGTSGGSGGGSSATAGSYGGGGSNGTAYCAGTNSVVRIIWPGTTRQFPSTNTGDMTEVVGGGGGGGGGVGAKLSGVTYTVSSTYSTNTAPTYAVMNDDSASGLSGQWGSDNDSVAFIKADAGSAKTITKVVVGYDYSSNLPGGWGPTYTYGLSVQISTDNSNWTNVGTTPSSTPSNGLAEITFTEVSARYVRLTKSRYMAVTEFQVWGY